MPYYNHVSYICTYMYTLDMIFLYLASNVFFSIIVYQAKEMVVTKTGVANQINPSIVFCVYNLINFTNSSSLAFYSITVNK